MVQFYTTHCAYSRKGTINPKVSTATAAPQRPLDQPNAQRYVGIAAARRRAHRRRCRRSRRLLRRRRAHVGRPRSSAAGDQRTQESAHQVSRLRCVRTRKACAYVLRALSHSVCVCVCSCGCRTKHVLPRAADECAERWHTIVMCEMCDCFCVRLIYNTPKVLHTAAAARPPMR